MRIMMNDIRKLYPLLKQFIQEDIWRMQAEQLPKKQAVAIRLLRIFLAAVQEFKKNHSGLRASALTFYSVLSIVPVAAMAFGIAEGFGFEKKLEKELLNNFPGQEEIIRNVITYADKLLENTQGGLIAGIGVAVLFWTVIKVLGHIEISLNALWGISSPRTLGRKLSDYLAIMISAPLLLIISGSVTVFIRTQLIMITEKIQLLDMFSRFIFFGLKLIPFALVWLLFSLLYILMPNGKVQFLSGISAGIIAGTIYQFTQWVYIHFQIGVAAYNTIYGSFAALPLFLLWLQISWLIVLFGAAISTAHQNADCLEFAPDSRKISYSCKKLLFLYTAREIIRNFAEGKPPMTQRELAEQLDIPLILVRITLKDLAQSRIIQHIQSREPQETAFQPARDIHSLDIAYLIRSLDRQGYDGIPFPENEVMHTLTRSLEEFQEMMEKSPKNCLLKDL